MNLLQKTALFLIALSFFSFSKTAVTYELSGGRFGDNLLSYLHAKWLAYQNDIPLLYAPFPYAPELNFSDKELQAHISEGKVLLSREFPNITSAPTLFSCPYFPEAEEELKRSPYYTFNVDWKHPDFRKMALEMISPKKRLQLVEPPKETINIALHIREGGGYDNKDLHWRDPLKTPPLHFYADCLLKVLEHFKGRPIYCHFFTDALNPQEIEKQLKQLLPSDLNLSFHYRKENNYHDANVLEDFFSLFNFDILIRPESNFSIIPSLLNDYAMICRPKSYSLDGIIPTIEEIAFDIDETLFENCSIKYRKLQ